MLNQVRDILDELRMLTKIVKSQSAAVKLDSYTFYGRRAASRPWHETNLTKSASARHDLLRRLQKKGADVYESVSCIMKKT